MLCASFEECACWGLLQLLAARPFCSLCCGMLHWSKPTFLDTCDRKAYLPLTPVCPDTLFGRVCPPGSITSVRSSSVIWNEVILRVNGALLCFFPLPSLSNAFVSWERKDTKAYQWKHHNLLKTLKLFHNTCKNVY